MTIDVSKSKAQKLIDELCAFLEREGASDHTIAVARSHASGIYWQGRDDERNPRDAYNRKDVQR